LNIASHLRVLPDHVLPDCNEYNQNVAGNHAHHVSNAPSHGAAKYPVASFFTVSIMHNKFIWILFSKSAFDQLPAY
jgi:hypothetical protein